MSKREKVVCYLLAANVATTDIFLFKKVPKYWKLLVDGSEDPRFHLLDIISTSNKTKNLTFYLSQFVNALKSHAMLRKPFISIIKIHFDPQVINALLKTFNNMPVHFFLQQVWEKELLGDPERNLFLTKHTFVHVLPSCMMNTAKAKINNFVASFECKCLQETVVALIVSSCSIERAGVIFAVATKIFLPKNKTTEMEDLQKFLTETADNEAVNLTSCSCSPTCVDTFDNSGGINYETFPYFVYFNKIFEKNISADSETKAA